MADDTFWDLFAQHAIASLEKQHRLGQLMTEGGTAGFDMKEGVLRIRNGELAVPMQILGTEAEGDNTWLWAWANEASGIPRHLLADANKLRALGQSAGITCLTEPNWTIDRIDGHALAIAAAGVCGADAYYRCEYKGGAAFVTLRHADIRSRPGFDATSFKEMLSSIVSWDPDEPGRYPFDHRAAVDPYLKDRPDARQIGDSVRFLLGEQEIFTGFCPDRSLKFIADLKAGEQVSMETEIDRVARIVAEAMPANWTSARFSSNFMLSGMGGTGVKIPIADGSTSDYFDLPTSVIMKILCRPIFNAGLRMTGSATIRVVIELQANGDYSAEWGPRRPKTEPEVPATLVTGRWKPSAAPAPAPSAAPALKKPWWKVW